MVRTNAYLYINVLDVHCRQNGLEYVFGDPVVVTVLDIRRLSSNSDARLLTRFKKKHSEPFEYD